MPIYVGSTEIDPSGCSKVYYGSTLVYQKETPTSVSIDLSNIDSDDDFTIWINSTKYYLLPGASTDITTTSPLVFRFNSTTLLYVDDTLMDRVGTYTYTPTNVSNIRIRVKEDGRPYCWIYDQK